MSVIVPVRDGARFLESSLPALAATLPETAELIVSDDGSTDGSAQTAASLGARVVTSPISTGAAAARNRAARVAVGEVLVFIDADCRVHRDTLAKLTAPLEDPSIGASFGSYDAAPKARSWVSLYKNLAHHFVHQRSSREASTFWAACGSVRRTSFEAINGFDESYLRPSIEDVELGYRLRSAGLRIRLVPDAQVTHLKRWTLLGVLTADLRDRAIPWARLWRAGRGLPRELNFTVGDRIATALVAGGVSALALRLFLPVPLGVAAACVAFALAADLPLLAFLARAVSPAFVPVAALLQVLHRVTALLGLAIGFLAPALPRRPPSS
jgi:glycosyltransferase involved in cell wall biosynthesis